MNSLVEKLLTPEEVRAGVVVVASNNAHKLVEIRTILGELMPGIEFRAMGEFEGLPEPDETGSTFEENAFIKSDTIHRASGLPALADDSGLVVDALGGAPGVRSARYAGVHGDDAANNAKLLVELEGVADAERTARFMSCVSFSSARVRACGIGACEGVVGHEGRGSNGFGYDPLFWPQDTPGRTMAELLPEEKNAISHRKHAIEALAQELAKLG